MPLRKKEWSGVITLRAINKKQRPCKVSPLEDPNYGGRVYTGQGKSGYGFSTEQERANASVLIDQDTIFTLKHLVRFDMEDEVDKAQWNWIQHHPYVAWSKEEADASPDAVFYVENRKEEAQSFNEIERLIAKAKNLIYFEADEEALKDAAQILGVTDPNSFFESREEMEQYLAKQAETQYSKLIKYLNPKNQEENQVTARVARMIKEGIIWRATGGVWRYGEREDGVYLGRTEAQIVEFILDPKNQDIAYAMQEDLNALVRV